MNVDIQELDISAIYHLLVVVTERESIQFCKGKNRICFSTKLETRPARIHWWTPGKLTDRKAGAREKAQWLRAPAPLAMDLGSGPSIHIRQLTAACNSTSRDLTHSSGLYGHQTYARVPFI